MRPQASVSQRQSLCFTLTTFLDWCFLPVSYASYPSYPHAIFSVNCKKEAGSNTALWVKLTVYWQVVLSNLLCHYKQWSCIVMRMNSGEFHLYWVHATLHITCRFKCAVWSFGAYHRFQTAAAIAHQNEGRNKQVKKTGETLCKHYSWNSDTLKHNFKHWCWYLELRELHMGVILRGSIAHRNCS